MPVDFTTTVGRIVWGNPGKSQPKTDTKTKLPLFDSSGQPRKVTAFGVAFPKAEFAAYIDPYLKNEAATGFPSGVPRNFAWKVIDGDTVDAKGKPYSDREGYAGHMIVSFSTEVGVPPIVKFNPQTGGYDQLPTEAIKTGDYVTVGVMAKLNIPTDPTNTPGLYVNPRIVEFVGYGTEIVSVNAPDAATVFGGRQHQLPPGASLTPIGHPTAPGLPAPGAPPAAPGYAAPPAAPGYAAPPAAPGYAAPPAAPGYAAPPAAPPVPGNAVGGAAPPYPVSPAASPPYAPPVPTTVSVDPMAQAAADGWVAHPQAPGHFYRGQEVKSAADLAAMYSGAPAPAPAPDFAAGHGTYPGQPGMMPPR